jgi:hypothetical protein
LAEFDWESHPLLVDLSLSEDAAITSASLDLVYSEFTFLKRLSSGGPCFLIAARYERNDSFCFGYGISFRDRSVLNLVRNAAKISVQNIITSLDQEAPTLENWGPTLSILKNRDPVFDLIITFVKSSHGRGDGDAESYDYQHLSAGPRHSQIEILQNIPLNDLPKKIVAR